LKKCEFFWRNTTPARAEVKICLFVTIIFSYNDVLVEKGNCQLAFSFMRCILEDNKQLKEIWRNYDDGIDMKVFN